MSASIGCSVHASDEIDDLNQLIESADKRMYEEKKRKTYEKIIKAIQKIRTVF